jgi:hypothetical protein
MPVRCTLSALMLFLILSAPALAGDSAGSPPPEPSGPVIVEDFCPG